MREHSKACIARGEKPQKREVNISLVSALSLTGVVASSNIYGAVDGVTYYAVY